MGIWISGLTFMLSSFPPQVLSPLNSVEFIIMHVFLEIGTSSYWMLLTVDLSLSRALMVSFTSPFSSRGNVYILNSEFLPIISLVTLRYSVCRELTDPYPDKLL